MTRIDTTVGNYEHLKDCLKGEKVYIVGSGPSLIGYDFSRFKDLNVISVNHALFDLIEAGVTPKYHVFLDQRFLQEAGISLESLPVFSITSSNSSISPRIDKLAVIPADNIRHTYSPNPKQGFYTPKNGICFSISVAIYMGAPEIYLCGADCKFINKDMAQLIAIRNENIPKAFEIKKSEREWYGHYSSGARNHTKDHVSEKHNEIFEVFAELYDQFKDLPMKIYNCSFISAIQTFERKPLP